MARLVTDDLAENFLRAQVAMLRQGGLTEDEARMVALRRLRTAGLRAAVVSSEIWVVLAMAIGAGVAIKVPEWLGFAWGGPDAFYPRNLALFALLPLVGYFGWKRGLPARTWLVLGSAFGVAALTVNLYPFEFFGQTARLSALHLPVALWLAVGLAHAGWRWSEAAGRMDFVRFSGELFIHYVLIAMGGGVLMAITLGLFKAIGIDAERLLEWIVPSCAMGAVVVAAWLVESRHGLAEGIAPLLTRVFTPLFTLALLAFLGTVAWTGHGIDRNALIAFDVLLALVLGLLLYSISSRERDQAPGAFDLLLVLLLLSALVADAIALYAIAGRISDFGFTPNRSAVLGFNLILLANLSWAAVLHLRFLRGRGTFEAIERWQMAYLPVYSLWAALIVTAFPPAFRFQ